ncbi:MAG TPA: NAD(P)-dependent alcohol dehydrogenase [Polyangiales bacterium]
MIVRSESAELVPHELPVRALKAREVRVAVRAIGVNPVDWKLSDNGGLRLAHALLGPSGPFVCGIDFAGVVVELGEGAQGVSVGDPVAGAVDFRLRQRGSYATEVIVRDTQVAVLPAHVDLPAAACLPVAGVTAHMALFEHGGLQRGGKALVLGASGGVGHLAVQLARNHGAKVFGVCSSRNAGLVTRLGAHVIAHDEGDALERAREHGPFDVVVNAVDTQHYPVARVAPLLAPRGRHVILTPSPRDYPCLARPSVTTFSAFARRESLAPLVSALADGSLEVVIADRFPLEYAEQAHQLSRTGKVVGKVVLTVNASQEPAAAHAGRPPAQA